MARWLALSIHSHFGISRGITNIPTAIILKLRCKLSNELKCRLLSRALSRGGGSFLFGKKAVTSIRRAVVYSLTGAIFNWEKERIQDWEMNELVKVKLKFSLFTLNCFYLGACLITRKTMEKFSRTSPPLTIQWTVRLTRDVKASRIIIRCFLFNDSMKRQSVI